VYASHYPEASTHSHGGQSVEVSSILKTSRFDSAGPNTAIEHTTDFSRLLEILLDVRKQQYAMGYEMQDLKNAFMATSVSLHDQLQALKNQVQTTVQGEEFQSLKQGFARLEKTVNSMGEFKLVRLPKQP